MGFKKGDTVQDKGDPSRIGKVEELGPLHAGIQYYIVFWGGTEGTKTVPEVNLHLYVSLRKPIENLASGNLAGYGEFQRIITHSKLFRDFPLKNNIYAFNASRTRFYPYQFKPLMKILESPSQRLIICDEVGLGKTIEAGLILTELQARHAIQRVLVVCPANLREKWKMELKRRFGEEFQILGKNELTKFFKEYKDDPNGTKLNGIVSLETIRGNDILEEFDELLPQLDVVIVDEAHHMRNRGTKQWQAGVLLSSCANAMLMLTATPIHLGDENLFSLLNILDENDFPDYETSKLRFQQNESIVESQKCLSVIPPRFGRALESLKKASESEWIKGSPILEETTRELESLESAPGKSIDRSLLVRMQRNLADLNLLGHIFTRTRKREVHEFVARRKAFSLEVTLSRKEIEFYNAVTEFVKAKSSKIKANPILLKWSLHMPQRMMSSSFPAMVERYRSEFGLSDTNLSDELEIEDGALSGDEDNLELAMARKELTRIVASWHPEIRDSKYESFVSALKEIKGKHVSKILVFAFFKGTLEYLKKRLSQDGFNCRYMSGDVPSNQRVSIIDQFREDPSVEILLSSRIGSEGLDFQFCQALVNYDLPWNPMEVEQRIGRLDRIGQESPIILIYNLWLKDTIEERILKRLYDRIQIFERSIGELESILGDVVQKLENDAFSLSLSTEEASRRAEEALKALEMRKQQLEQLESEAAEFIGTDQYFEEEVNLIRKSKRYVTGEQLRNFVVDFLQKRAPGSRLEADRKTSLSKLYPDSALKSLILSHGKSSDLNRFLVAKDEGVALTFDSEIAFRDSKVEFINILHPLVGLIMEEYAEDEFYQVNAQYFQLESMILPKGLYFYFVFRIRAEAALRHNILECVILDETLEPACDSETAEAVVGEMVELGTDVPIASVDVNAEEIWHAYRKAEVIFLEHFELVSRETKTRNDVFVDRRLTSQNAYYGKRMDKIRELINRNPEERITRMHKSMLDRLKGELEQKQQDLEKRRAISLEYDDIAAGILVMA